MPSGSSYQPPSHSRRRTVRIVKQRNVSRAAIISLAIATGAAVLFLAIWRIMQSGEELSVHIREIREYDMDWRCEGGHSFHSAGRKDSRPCWICGQPAFPVAHYKCPIHGTFEVAFRFYEDEQGIIKPSKIRVGSGEWLEFDEGLKCPRCRRDLMRDNIDPLDRAESRRP